MKKVFVIVIVVLLILIYTFSLTQIDTKYAVRFGDVFSSYDIEKIDEYLSEDTIIICNGKSACYKEVRDNVYIACSESPRKFNIISSYGHGDDIFIFGPQKVEVFLGGDFKGNGFDIPSLNIYVKQTSPFTFKITKLESDEPMFDYMFFGVEENNGDLIKDAQQSLR
ncbi:MAG: hypothetical protein IKD89_08330 [Clostridia bacterium]|nr:hypothetical protein [Clostridia bacterium]